MSQLLQQRIEDLLGFWFGAPDQPGYGKPRAQWYRKDTQFDDACRERFQKDLETAARGEWESVQSSPRGALALTLLLDQIPRNIFRGSPRAFATDPQALEVASRAIDAGHESALPPVLRRFFYMPFEHSERLEDQRRAVELARTTANDPGGEEVLDYAVRHFKVIERFGRFPHRNELLGRVSTPEEENYLRSGGERF